MDPPADFRIDRGPLYPRVECDVSSRTAEPFVPCRPTKQLRQTLLGEDLSVVGSVAVEERAGAVIVRLVGDHDLSTVAAISDAIERGARSDRRVVLDLSDASFIDSTVLGLVLRSADRCVPVAGPGSFAARRIALFGVATFLRVASSFEEAVSWLGSETAP